MKKIGLIGGMSWESSIVYYQLVNEIVREKLGGHFSAKCIMDSVEFNEIVKLQHENEWGKLDDIMAESARNLEKAGAEIIILCTNTMHLCSQAIKQAVNIPFLHIAEATGTMIHKNKLQKVLLLGTRFTMEKDFYRKTLKDCFDIDVLIPEEKDRERVHHIIYNELVHGQIKDSSRKEYQEIIRKSMQLGAEGVILGCTEIPLLIKENDSPIPVFDTTGIHAQAAVEFALSDLP